MNPDRAAFRFAVDRDPAETRRKVLACLAATPAPMRRRSIQQVVWNTDLMGAGQTIQAIRWLIDEGMVESAYNPMTTRGTGMYRITEKGRDALAVAQSVMGESA